MSHDEIAVAPPASLVVSEGADQDGLTPAAAVRVADGWAANTRRAFAHDWRNFADWCAVAGRRSLPATGATLANYVVHLIETAMPAPATLERAIGTVQAHHRAVDLSVNATPARLALRSYRREWAAEGGRVRQAAALTVEQLRTMLEVTGDGLAGLRDRTLLLIGFTMMARRSELACIDIGDVRIVDDGLEVFLPTSKTDKDSVGTTVRVPYGTLAQTCAVRTTHAWLTALAEHGLTDGPLLRGVDRHGRLAGTPGATGRGTGRMSGAGINLVVKRLAEAAGLEGVSAHSLRAGSATAAAMAGVPRAQIAFQGRWEPKSTAVDAYIRPADAWRDNPMRKVGL